MTNDWPPRPPIPSVSLNKVYQYQGGNNSLKNKMVKVISLTYPGSSDPAEAHLVHVQVVNKKGEPTETTFGCDPRWLAEKGLSPYREYSNLLSRGNKNIKPAIAEPFGLVDPDDQAALFTEGIDP